MDSVQCKQHIFYQA